MSTKKTNSGLKLHDSPNQWSTTDATYWWIIWLDPTKTYKGKFQNANKPLHGYTKKVNESERLDKVELLMKKIVMFHREGYFERVLRIDIYMKTGEFINKSTDPCILQLFPTHHDIPEQVYDFTYKRWGRFLTGFWDCIKRGMSPETLIPRSRSIQSRDELLDIAKVSLENVGDLNTYCDRMIRWGFAPGRVEAFRKAYRMVKNWEGDNNSNAVIQQNVNEIARDLTKAFTSKPHVLPTKNPR